MKQDSTCFYCLLSGYPEACCFLQVLLLSSRRTHPHLKCHRVQLASRLQRLQSFNTTWPIPLSLQTVRQPASPSRPNHLTPPLTSQSQPPPKKVAGHFRINCTSDLFSSFTIQFLCCKHTFRSWKFYTWPRPKHQKWHNQHYVYKRKEDDHGGKKQNCGSTWVREPLHQSVVLTVCFTHSHKSLNCCVY